MAKQARDPFSLRDQVALITGGGTGLGLGIACAFVARGARVVITGRREAVLQASAASLGAAADYRVHDVTDSASHCPLVGSVEAEFGPISCLVNNAGNLVKKPTEELSDEEMLEVLNTHLLGAFSLTRTVARRMLDSNAGSILFTASMTSLFGIPYVAAYATAKSAYLGLVRTMATEWSSRGVRVNAIAPGWILTDLSRESLDADPERKARILARTPMKCFGEPEDIGNTAAFLASPAAKFITGACIPVDGGASIGF
ncbi:MAG: SDR family oxidoreductase [Candidatus Latescibacterota bacterium]|nr:SDR family oxidoreductase [Candidatus Latescibacterota bacterium]